MQVAIGPAGNTARMSGWGIGSLVPERWQISSFVASANRENRTTITPSSSGSWEAALVWKMPLLSERADLAQHAQEVMFGVGP